MEVTIVDNEIDAKEVQCVLGGYAEMINGDLSREEWEADFPRKQWLKFEKGNSLPYIVVDNRDGQCFVEDFATLDGALQYLLDIHMTHEDQEDWDVNGRVKEIGGFFRDESSDSLPDLVLDWADLDQVVIDKGWTDAHHEEQWERFKRNMVAEAKRQKAQKGKK